MTRYFFAVGFLINLLVGTVTGDTVKGPRIFCADPEFNFGTVDNQTVVEHTFVIQNTGDTTLEINNIRAACGCTVADVSTRTIPPGAEATMTARLNLQGRTGYQSKPISVHSNDPEQPVLRLNMVGQAQQGLSVTPIRMMFGQAGAGQQLTLPVTIATATDADFAILGIESSHAGIQVEQETATPGREYRLNVTLRAPTQPGSLAANIRVQTDHPSRPVIDIPVFANVVGDLLFTPPEITLPANTPGPITRHVVIRAGTSGPFEITGVETPDPAMDTQIFPFGGNGYRVHINNIQPGPHLNGQAIRITTTAGIMKEITIPLRLAE